MTIKSFLTIEKAIITEEDGSKRVLPFTLEHIGFMVYLNSLEKDFVVSKESTCSFFSIGKERYYRLVKDLKDIGLIIDTETERECGRFKKSNGLSWVNTPFHKGNVEIILRKPYKPKRL